MTLLIVLIAAFALYRLAVNSAAASRAATRQEKTKRSIGAALSALAIVLLLFVMKGAGFVVGIGLLLPALVVGAAVLGALLLVRAGGAASRRS